MRLYVPLNIPDTGENQSAALWWRNCKRKVEFLRKCVIEVSFLDLLCVLILSGLQQDDLDVNMLLKLRRRNVNVEDVNNGWVLYQHLW